MQQFFNLFVTEVFLIAPMIFGLVISSGIIPKFSYRWT